MAREMIGPHRRRISQDDGRPADEAEVPGVREVVALREMVGRARNPDPCGVCIEVRWSCRDIDRRIIEEGDLPIGMAHRAKPRTHAVRSLPPGGEVRCREPIGEALCQLQEIEEILEEERVIHRTPLEVAPIREDLFGQLRAEGPQARGLPPVCLRPLEEAAAEEQRLKVRPEMVAKEVIL
jgi:hypothetical protein